jgi:hypothetical protein
MATKKELIDKIQSIAQRVYAGKTREDVLDLTPQDADLDVGAFPLLSKFPTLRDTIVSFLTDQYELFISDIQWVAPRPTTFKIILTNQQFFYLIYTERSWVAQIEGKKYYLRNINEEQRAIESVARILMYGSKAEPEKEEGGLIPSSGETPPDETAPEAFTPEPPAPESEEEAPE